MSIADTMPATPHLAEHAWTPISIDARDTAGGRRHTYYITWRCDICGAHYSTMQHLDPPPEEDVR